MVFLCQGGNGRVHVQRRLHLLGQGAQRREQPLVLLPLDSPQRFGRVQGKQIQHRQLGGVALGGGHGNLRACPCVQGVVGDFRNGTAHHVHNGKRLRTPALAFLHGGNGIRRLAGLGQDDEQRMPVNQGVCIAKLTCQLRSHGDTAQLLDGIFPRAPGIIGRAAGRNDDFMDLGKIDVQVVQYNFPISDSRGDGRFHRPGLLHDLLEHEVVVAALFRRLDVPCDAAGLLGDGVA